MIVVSDASPLNILMRIGHVDVLAALFGKVLIPPAVASELSHAGTPSMVRDWIAQRPPWLDIQAPSRIDASLGLDDAGEREAISLALELRADYLLADDKKARRAAQQRGLVVTGAVGVIELAAAMHLLSLPDAFERLRSTDFIISQSILDEALSRHARRTGKD